MKEKLFYESRPLQCHAKLAHMIGLSHAIVFQQMKWLVSGAPDDRKKLLGNGNEFVEYTQDWLIREHFPFLCVRQLRRIFDDLQGMGLIAIESYVDSGKTHNLYAICPAHEVLLTSERYGDFLELAFVHSADDARSQFREQIKKSYQNDGGHDVLGISGPTGDMMSGLTGDINADKEDTNTKKKEEDKVDVVVSEFVDEWKKHPDFRQIANLSPKRKHSIRVRMKEDFFKEHWKSALQFIEANDFYKGKNERQWVANVEWFLRPDTIVKIVEQSQTKPRFNSPSQYREMPTAN